MADTPLLTVADVGKRLNCSDDTVRGLVARRLIAHVRVGQGTKKARIRFTEADVEAYIAKQRIAPIEDASSTPRVNAPRRSAERRLLDLPEARRYA